MDFSAVESFIKKLPEGEHKEILKRKLAEAKKQFSKKEDSGAIEDTFELKPKGHIKIEKILENGETEVLLEKKNMVVKGSEEILTKAFSGDPGSIIYKIRRPTVNQDTAAFQGARVSPEYKLKKDGAMSVAISKNDVGIDDAEFDMLGYKMSFGYMDYWNCVKDEDFDVYYSYEPEIMYAFKTRTVTGKDMFRIIDVPGWDKDTIKGETIRFEVFNATSEYNKLVALPPEIYSTHTNFFIAMGDGETEKKEIKLKTKGLNVFSYSGFLENTDGSIQTEDDEKFLEFEQDFNNLEIDITGTNVKFQIFLDDNSEPMYFSSVTDNLTEMYGSSFDGLDYDYDLSKVPVGELKIYKNNILLIKGVDYQWTSGTKEITFVEAPVSGDEIVATYKTKAYLLEGESEEIKTISGRKVLKLTGFAKKDKTKTKVKIKIQNSETGILKINEIKSDFICYEDNDLISEIKELEYKFNIPTERKTTIFHDAQGLYTIDLERRTIVKGSLKIKHKIEVEENVYEDSEFLPVESKEKLLEKGIHKDFYYCDYGRGILYFRRVLTGLFISFETTGQVFVYLNNSDKANPYFVNENTKYTKASKTLAKPEVNNIGEANSVKIVKQDNYIVTNTSLEDSPITSSSFATKPNVPFNDPAGIKIEIKDRISVYNSSSTVNLNPRFVIRGTDEDGNPAQGTVTFIPLYDGSDKPDSGRRIRFETATGGKEGEEYSQKINIRLSSVTWDSGVAITNLENVDSVEIQNWHKSIEFKKIVLPFSIVKDENETDLFFYHPNNEETIQRIHYCESENLLDLKETEYFFETNTLDPLSRTLYVPLKGMSTKTDKLHDLYVFNGSEKEFNLTAVPEKIYKVKLNGNVIETGYTIIADTIEFTNAPSSTDKIEVIYYTEKGLHDVEEAELNLMSSRGKGYITNYKRALTERPKQYEQQWYNLDTGSVDFVAEFKAGSPAHTVKITELMLTNGPRKTPVTGVNPDSVMKPKPYVSVPFSIVRLYEDAIIKDPTTAIKVTWRITLQDKDNIPFSGGSYSE